MKCNGSDILKRQSKIVSLIFLGNFDVFHTKVFIQ